MGTEFTRQITSDDRKALQDICFCSKWISSEVSNWRSWCRRYSGSCCSFWAVAQCCLIKRGARSEVNGGRRKEAWMCWRCREQQAWTQGRQMTWIMSKTVTRVINKSGNVKQRAERYTKSIKLLLRSNEKRRKPKKLR